MIKEFCFPRMTKSVEICKKVKLIELHQCQVEVKTKF